MCPIRQIAAIVFFALFSSSAFANYDAWIAEAYLELISYNDQDISEGEIKTKIIVFLNFCEKAIAIYEENITNRYNINNMKRKQPVYISGEFSFIEIEGGRIAMDPIEKVWREMAYIDGPVELGNYAAVHLTYNKIIDYWYQKTGEILRDKYDIQKMANRIKTVFNKNKRQITFRVDG
jgi:hypothetical protein